MEWNLYKNNKFLEPLCFSNEKTQNDVIKEVLKSIDKGNKVIFIHGMCGTGKSAIALNIARNLGKTSIIVPGKNLQNQYKKDYEGDKYLIKENGEKLKISVITGRNNHKCKFLEDNRDAIPKVKKEIHYDIEDDPMNEFVYMHGFWIIEEGKNPHYQAIVATRDKTEEEVTKELWAFFAANEGVPIYHYSGHEKTTCRKLMEKYKLDTAVYDAIFGPGGTAIDLYDWIVANTDWPLTSYGLKAICKYTGFKWSAEDAGGANSISWFFDYMNGDDEMMEKILTYNEEDCKATAHMKEWLIENA